MAKNSLIKNILKAGIVTGTAGLMMGNQSCQQQPVAKRELRRLVEMGKVTSPVVNLPEGGTFDFEYVANQQIYAILQNSQHFSLRYQPPVVTVPTAFSGETKALSIGAKDAMMMKAFAMKAGVSDKIQYSKDAECMINLPNAKIYGSVNSFEMLGGAGVNIGFDPTGAHNVSGLSLIKANVQSSQLDLSLAAISPLSKKTVSAANVTAKQTKGSFSLGFNIGVLSIGPSAYYQTPLATVTKTGLTSGVNALFNNWTAIPWQTRVLMNHDTHLAIVGGVDMNLKVGDRLNVYNDEYYWDGEPCAPDARYIGGGAKDPVAVIELDWVGDEVSRGRVIQQTDENAVPGARVTLLKLAEDIAAEAAAAKPTPAPTPAK
jgi:hypothetical protein